MAKITLVLEPRTVTGKKVKQLRKQKLIPANIFGKMIKSTAVQVKSTDFYPVEQQAGETQIIYVKIGDEKEDRPVLITDIQVDPISGERLHIDFRQVDLKEKITAAIPVEIVGEAPAVKDFQASLVTTLSEIEVEALPADLPESFKVDVSILKNVGDSIKISDLKIDQSKIEVKDDPESIIVSAAEQQKEEVIEAPVPEAEAEAGEAGAPGEAAPEADKEAAGKEAAESKAEEKKE